MKKLILLATILVAALVYTPTYGQADWNLGGNFIGPTNFLGSINNEPLRFQQNNIERARFVNGTFAGYNGQSAQNNVNRIHLGINGNFQAPFSMLHIGYTIDPALSRPWMNVGTTMGAGRDIMHVGLLQGPAGSTDSTNVDAVVAWGCNDQIWSPANGPDNLRFLFLAPSDVFVNTPGRNPEGLETMRITPWGYVGIGDSFSNALQPHRRTVVHEQTDSAQFRIAHSVNTNPILGDHADFQVTDNGVLHIKPRHAGNTRAMAVGFLDGELNTAVDNFARLDVGGRTRIRLLEDTASQCLITGFNASTNPADNYLTRLDFIGATDSVLSGAGTWVPMTTTDCRWIDESSVTVFDETDMYTGFIDSSDCDRGKVGIGVNQITQAKLEVATAEFGDDINTGIYSVIRTQNDPNTPGINYAVLGEAINAGQKPEPIVGVRGNAKFAKVNVGVFLVKRYPTHSFLQLIT